MVSDTFQLLSNLFSMRYKACVIVWSENRTLLSAVSRVQFLALKLQIRQYEHLLVLITDVENWSSMLNGGLNAIFQVKMPLHRIFKCFYILEWWCKVQPCDFQIHISVNVVFITFKSQIEFSLSTQGKTEMFGRRPTDAPVFFSLLSQH